MCLRQNDGVHSFSGRVEQPRQCYRVREKGCHLFRGWHGVGATSGAGDASFQEDRRLISPDLVVFIKTMCFRFFFFKIVYVYLAFMSVLSVCICTIYMFGASRGQKRALEPLKLQLRMVVSHRVGTGNQTPVPEGAEVLLTTEPLLQPCALPDAVMSD